MITFGLSLLELGGCFPFFYTKWPSFGGNQFFIVGAKYDSKTIVLYIKQKPKAVATIYKKSHVDMIISVDMKTIQSSGIQKKQNTLYYKCL